MTLETLFDEVGRLPDADKWRLVNHILRTLEHKQTQASSDWHEALRATYGILADDPIERPEQLPLQDREPLE